MVSHVGDAAVAWYGISKDRSKWDLMIDLSEEPLVEERAIIALLERKLFASFSGQLA